MLASISQIWRKVQQSGSWRNRYFIAGLAAQKGLPIVVLPLLIANFGASNFADYVLMYTVVQVFANLSSLAIPQAIVPLWFKQSDPDQFVGSCLGLMAALAVAAGACLLLTLAALAPQASLDWPLPTLTAAKWVVAYAFIYNLNQLAVGVARVQDRQGRFFASAFLGAAILIAGATAAPVVGLASLQGLLGLQVAALATTTVLLMGHRWGSSLTAGLRLCGARSSELLRFTLPLAGYTLLVLYVMSVDKWIVRAAFPAADFTAYVLDYQFAFAVMFVPTAIVLFFGPKVSALVARADHTGLAGEERKARRLALAGSVGVAAAMAGYAHITSVPLTGGFWALVAGFLCEGQFALLSSRLTAQLQSLRLMAIALMGALVYSLALGLAARIDSLWLVYAAQPLYLGINLLTAAWISRTDARASA